MRISIFYVTVMIVTLSGCGGEPEEKKPITDEFRYDLKKNLEYDAAQKEYRAVFLGTRCYTPHGGHNSTIHEFFFDKVGPVDKLIVAVTDAFGLDPGTSYGYVLQQLSPPHAGSGKTLQTWNLTLQNPSNATEKRHRFEFVIDLAGSQGFVWDPKQKVAGQYEFGSTTRDTSILLELQVGNPVTADAFCDYKD